VSGRLTAASHSSPTSAATAPRRAYLDWLRGVGVLIMISSHTLDSWTRPDERSHPGFVWSNMIGGYGAPIFLFLAGLALTLAVSSRMRKGATQAEAVAAARRRGWQIFGLAFLFRLQSWLISGGGFPGALLKVDILNIMGLSLVGCAALWGVARGRWTRVVLLAGAAVAVAMLTPLVRATPLLAPLPDPLEWYVRPAAGRTTFTLFPWAAFLFAGAALGVLLDAARGAAQERRLNVILACAGPAIAMAGYAASFLPPIYPVSSFWTTSPTFFFLRLGVLLTALPVAYAWTSLWRGRSPIREFGLASLFVYWIHVELAYGVLSLPLHKRLPFEAAVAGFVLFTMMLFGLVKLRDHIVANRPKGGLLSAVWPGTRTQPG
jgi:uncharacterized membrane protein